MVESMMYEIVTDSQCARHAHKNFEILYVVQGKVSLTIEKTSYLLQQDDLVIINSGQPHGWQSFGNCRLLRSQIDFYEIAGMCENRQVSFSCNSVMGYGTDFGHIRYLIRHLLSLYAEGSRQQLLLKGTYYEMWHMAVKNYLTEEAAEQNDPVIREILHYISQHYREAPGLAFMAEKWFMSESSFSRFFRKYVGVNYSQYMLEYRLDRACDELQNTNKSIADIAYASGFSDATVLNKNFRKKYGMSPVAYRNAHAEGAAAEKETASGEGSLAVTGSADSFFDPGRDGINVTVDVTKGTAFQNSVKMCMNAGFASNVLAGKLQSHIRQLQEIMHFKYLRIRNIFREDMQLFSGDEGYNFEQLDNVIDFILSLNAIPVIVLNDEGQDVILHIGAGKSLSGSGRDRDSQGELLVSLIEAFVLHLIRRYSRAMVGGWRFELRDEPKSHLIGDMPFMEFYQKTYRILKGYLPEVKVGSCELNCYIAENKLREYLIFWKNQGIMPDYLTTISFPYAIEFKNGKFKLLNLVSDEHFIRRDILEIKNMFRELACPEIPIWLTNWNTTLSERNVYNDSAGKGCHLVEHMLSVFHEVESVSYSSVSDYNSSLLGTRGILFGGTGLLSKDGLKKPAFYALDACAGLDGKMLEMGEHYIITAREDGGYSILVVNPQIFSGRYFLKQEDEWTFDELPYIFSDVGQMRMSFTLQGMQEGSWRLRRYRVTDRDSTILCEWKRMGYAKNLNQSERRYIDRICIPRMESSLLEIHDGKGSFQLNLDESEFNLITIDKY